MTSGDQLRLKKALLRGSKKKPKLEHNTRSRSSDGRYEVKSFYNLDGVFSVHPCFLGYWLKRAPPKENHLKKKVPGGTEHERDTKILP